MIIIGSVVSLRPATGLVRAAAAVRQARPGDAAPPAGRRPGAPPGAVGRRAASCCPPSRFGEPADWAPRRCAPWRELASYQWLVFTSANGVHALLRRLRQTGRDLRAAGRRAAGRHRPGDRRRAARLSPGAGPGAAGVPLREPGRGAQGDRWPGSACCWPVPTGAAKCCARIGEVAEVDQVAVYSQVDARGGDSEVFDCLRRGEIDYITLTSSNIARALARSLDDAGASPDRGGRHVAGEHQPGDQRDHPGTRLAGGGGSMEYTMEGVLEVLLCWLCGRSRAGAAGDANTSPTRQCRERRPGAGALGLCRGSGCPGAGALGLCRGSECPALVLRALCW